MTRKYDTVLFLIILFIGLITSLPVHADVLPPISGQAYDSLLAAQELGLQKMLEEQFPESEGYLVTGPIDPLLDIIPHIKPAYEAVRVISPDMGSYFAAIEKTGKLSIPLGHAGFDGHLYEIEYNGKLDTALILPQGQNRFLIWLKRVTLMGWNALASPKLIRYANTMMLYFSQIDIGNYSYKMRDISEFVMPDKLALYAADNDSSSHYNPDYLTAFESFRGINIKGLANGVDSIVLDSAASLRMIDNAPKEAWQNQYQPLFQVEYRDFLESGGDFVSFKTLTPDNFSDLPDGNYFFAINVSGKIRYVWKMSDSDIANIEKATGIKPAVPNETMLFPGEPLLCTGTFRIDSEYPNKLAEITVDSPHFFLFKIDGEAPEETSARTDHYLTSVGHLINALYKMGISTDKTVLKKF